MDDLDRQLLERLRADGRASYAQLGAALNLSPAAIKRRMRRLEERGAIRGYTAIVDHSAAGQDIQAFIELRISGATSVEQLEELATGLDEVHAFFTIAGDPDALAWVHVDDVEHLKRVIAALRGTGRVVGTKTLMVLGDWQRGG